MSNKRLLDRAVTPKWMNTALRLARSGKSAEEARQLLEIAMRDEIDSPTGRKKAATILAGSWLGPTPEAESLVTWAKEHADGDLRSWHLGVLLANYSFFDDLCSQIGRDLGLMQDLNTPSLRAAMKTKWGARGVVDVATWSGVRTLRAFSVLTGHPGDSASQLGKRLNVDSKSFPWLVHALLVARGLMEMDTTAIQRAPELFMFDLPASVPNGYPHLERHTEGGGRIVLRRVAQRNEGPPPTKQMSFGV